MYSYNQPPGSYGGPPGFGGYPPHGGGQSGAPGMGPPGMGPPGMQAPGMQQAQAQQPGRPGGMPPNFAPPPGMNFNAPVIRLGTAGSGRQDGGGRGDPVSGGGGRRGLGMGSNMDQQRQQVRESMMALAPPSREEVARTIFVGNITDGVGGDEGLERILRTAGGLRRWTRASDADNKPCKFGFAEYEDAESLETAIEILQDVEVPVKRPDATVKAKEGEPEQIEKAVLLVIVDDASKKYAEDWKGKRKETEEAVHFRIDTAKENLAGVLASLQHASQNAPTDADGDVSMQDGQIQQQADPITGEVITIPLSAEDELSDIPPEMRETVAAEIAAFRERSNRRDLERLKREEEIEAAAMGGRRSPPLSAPTGPAGGANGIPLGPRERGVAGAPSGPKGFQGAQIPKDYQAGVSFVNGGTNGTAGYARREDEDDPASDEELERRRRDKKESEQDRLFQDAERRWEHREKAKIAAMTRERQREEDDAGRVDKDRKAMADRLAAWNDDEEAARGTEEYYRDRGAWNRNRNAFRSREAQTDERDRMEEDREIQRNQRERERARGTADSFLDQQAEEMGRIAVPMEPQRFKMSLGAAAQKVQAATKPSRTAAEVEGLLEDEEEGDTTAKRTIVPIKIDFAAEGAMLSEEERRSAAQSLAAEIPNETEKLWKWPVRWEFLDDSVIQEQVIPFVERKIVEYLGVQEQMLIDLISSHIKDKGKPQDLVDELSPLLEEEAEAMVKKLWRMIIFFSESEKRGLST